MNFLPSKILGRCRISLIILIQDNMQQFLLFALLLSSDICLGQIFPPGDTLSISTYDTTSVDKAGNTLSFRIESKKQFPFCSLIFKVPNDCVAPHPANCCLYITNVYQIQKAANVGTVSCLNGYSLIWFYTHNISDAKAMVESMSQQAQDQASQFKKEVITCYVLNEKSSAYKIEVETKNGDKFQQLLYCGSHNTYNFVLLYQSFKNLNSNEDIQPEIRKIIRLR
jgi:hypothetical protein